jgi:hypothetical protein
MENQEVDRVFDPTQDNYNQMDQQQLLEQAAKDKS